uniref:Uncharacterized protein n=1 Tax=Romanomermis culicivorax TaxID=13658 RepID=A0A915K6L8_ROMCU
TFINEPEEILRTRRNVHQLSIQRETSDFVVDLTSRFPSTVATLMSTASKLACASIPIENSEHKNLI